MSPELPCCRKRHIAGREGDEYQEEGNASVQYKAKTQTTTIGTGNEEDAKVK